MQIFCVILCFVIATPFFLSPLLGLLLRRVGAAAGEETLAPAGEAFVPEVSHVLRAVFARFRAGLEGRGGRDVGVLLQGPEECRAVLKALGTVPRVSLARGEPGGAAAGGPPPSASARRGSRWPPRGWAEVDQDDGG